MIDVPELVAAQVRHDHPTWKESQVWVEVMRAIMGDGAYAETYRDARKYGAQAVEERRGKEPAD